ncbi:MAG: AAA family ATPase [Planctomycetota bacterium]
MRLDRVTLRSFKGLGEFAAGLAPGLNVVRGPNEAGKSSFLEALRAAFFESATTTSKAKVGRWVPWGTKAVPEVSVEFEAGGARYRVAKTFAKSKGKATLVDLASDATLADGPKHVDTRLGEILRMGDAAFLCSSWVEQGCIEDALDDAGSREDLRARLREAGAGAASAVDVDKAVDRRRRALSLPGALRELRGKLDEAARHAERVAEAVGRWRKREERAEDAGERTEEIAKRLAEIGPRLEEDAKHREAASELERAKRDLAAAKSALDSAEEAAGKIEELAGRLAEAEPALAGARTRGEAAKAGLEAARTAARKAELDEVLAKTSALASEAERLRAVADSPALERAELDALEKAAARVTELGAKLDAAELRVEVEALGNIEIVAPEGEGGLARGERREIRGDSELCFEIPGVARVTARGPVQDLSALREELAREQGRIEEALPRSGAADLAGARDVAAKATEARRDLARVDRERNELLAGRALAALEDERAALAENAPPDGPGDVAALQAELASARDEYVAADTRAKEARKQVDFWKTQQADVERLRKDLEEASLRHLAADTAAKKLSRYALAADEQLMLSRERTALERERGELKALVKVHREETPPFTADDLAAAEEEKGEAARRLGVLEREELALRLVKDAAKRAREELAVGDEEVIRGFIERVLPRLTAGRYGSADLNRKFEVETVSGTAHESAGVDALSVGAREQVALAMRLAMVEALSGDEPQLVVLDEALLGFDPERMKAACALLAEYAERHQIIIMTARPGTLEFPAGTQVNEIALDG